MIAKIGRYADENNTSVMVWFHVSSEKRCQGMIDDAAIC